MFLSCGSPRHFPMARPKLARLRYFVLLLQRGGDIVRCHVWFRLRRRKNCLRAPAFGFCVVASCPITTTLFLNHSLARFGTKAFACPSTTRVIYGSTGIATIGRIRNERYPARRGGRPCACWLF